MALLTFLLAVLAFVALILSCFYALEAAAAVLLPLRKAAVGESGPVAVVVPAHNEAAVIEATLASIRQALRPNDRLFVVADNCDDNTAEIAMRAGAAVLVRQDGARRGKGYALQFALDALKQDPPEVVIFVDADCRVDEEAINRLAGAAASSGRPVQGLYLMRAGPDAPASRKAAEFAWLLMNRVRMGGLYTLFDVCRLTGSGMALPWETAKDLDIASGEIVEDLALGLSLTEAGDAPLLCAEALIESTFPYREESAETQRARWEFGSLRLAARRAPSVFAKAAARRDIRLAAAALDLAIPPLGLLGAFVVVMLALGAIAAALGASAPFNIASWAFAALVAATVAAWARFGRDALAPSDFGALFSYFLQKIRVYAGRARGSTAEWTSTRRDDRSDAP